MNRRGRKRKAGHREPNGQPVRATERERAEDIMRPAREARERIHGVPEALSSSPDAGSVLGRLVLAGEVTPRQRDAGHLYESIVREYEAVVVLARGVASAGDLDHTHGYDDSDGTDPAYVERYEEAKGRYLRASRCLAWCGNPHAGSAVESVVILDAPLGNGDLPVLRMGLDALEKEFRA